MNFCRVSELVRSVWVKTKALLAEKQAALKIKNDLVKTARTGYRTRYFL